MDNQQLANWIFRAVAVLLALTVHEASHAWVALKLGDPTAKQAGRISLNPLVHLDPIGTVMLFLFGFGWAKPVEFNPHNLRYPVRDGAIIALGGPASNIACGMVFGLILRVMPAGGGSSSLLTNGLTLLRLIVVISFLLGVFNLVPIPPLDGSHILHALLPAEWRGGFEVFRRYGFLALLAVIFLFPTVLWTVILPPVMVLYSVATGQPFHWPFGG